MENIQLQYIIHSKIRISLLTIILFLSTSVCIKAQKENAPQKGVLLIPAYTYNAGHEIELGIARGNWLDGIQLPKRKIQTLAIGSGFGLMHNFTHQITAAKIHLLAIHAPLRIGLTPMWYTDYSEIEFALRPEIGYTYKYISLVYGYNLFLDKAPFNKINTHCFTIRYFIPIATNKANKNIHFPRKKSEMI